MGKRKTSAPKKKSPSKFTKSVQGLLILGLGVALAMSLISFQESLPEENWLGLVGHSLGWGLRYLFGFASFLIPPFLGWVAYRLIFQKEVKQLKVVLFGVLLISSAALLTILTPFGSVPFAYIYFEAARFNLEHLLGRVGSLSLFSGLVVASSLLLTEYNPLPHLKKLKKVPTPKIKFPKFERKRPFEGSEKKEEEFSLPAAEPVIEKRVILKAAPKIKAGQADPLPMVKVGEYALPPASLLTQVENVDQSELTTDLQRMATVLEETLLSFGIEAKVGEIHCGPTITSFEVHPAVGVKVQKIKALENDIALNMQARSIRIIAPIPGKAAVGIEVPNPEPQEVGFREMLETYQAGGKKGHIPLLLGKLVNGEDIWADLTKMPHLIIAGATGSGKSVCINTIVMSILMNARPDEIKLLMVDPKKVELSSYSKLPHMLAPVITEPGGATAALQWLVKEMEWRYELCRQLGIRNITGFNHRKRDEALEESLDMEVPEKLPYIVVIIDELADLMMVASSDIETPIARLAQMARAVGIHVILATQRPSREVITGLIKANFPTRLSFKVSSRVNSQIILDENGAECLLGNGDMLFLPPGTSNLVRAQGAFIRDDDINKVIDAIIRQAPTNYRIPSFDNFQDEVVGGMEEEGNDPLYLEAKKLVVDTGTASTTFLQRKLKIGYARAASLMDELEQHRIIGPQEGAKPRKIFYSTSDTEE